jgi:uncharacterized membrane protein YczE
MMRRLSQLYAGLILYGFSVALMIRGNLGLNPWNVFHQGIALQTGWSFGTVVLVVGAFVLLLWWPLRQRPGIGTISNVLVIGFATDVSLWVIGSPDGYASRFALLALGIILNGLAGAAYIGAGLGPGPRDGLMTGFVARTGRSIRQVSTSIELVVLAIGWLIGGIAGIGTVFYALTIGWIVQFFLPLLSVEKPGRAIPRRTLPIRFRRPARRQV